jgi:hypothetical protein
MEAKQAHPTQLRLPLWEERTPALPESIHREVISVVAALLCQVAAELQSEATPSLPAQEREHAPEAT